MNRLRKIGQWFWLNKERMVLAVMVGFLIFRVYQVLNPPPPANARLHSPPRKELDEDVARPGLPPPVPANPRSDDWSRLWRLNPLNYRQPRSRGGGGSGQTTEIDVTVLRITEFLPGRFRAQLRTPSKDGWYEEGDAFESYELLNIDPEAGTVTIFSEALQRTEEIALQD